VTVHVIHDRKNSADTKVNEQGGAPGAAAEIPLQPVDKTLVRSLGMSYF